MRHLLLFVAIFALTGGCIHQYATESLRPETICQDDLQGVRGARDTDGAIAATRDYLSCLADRRVMVLGLEDEIAWELRQNAHAGVSRGEVLHRFFREDSSGREDPDRDLARVAGGEDWGMGR